ncbi:MAG: DeoR/GlpR family DNA-binding transcription regulator [Pseudomonadota bacterium]
MKRDSRQQSIMDLLVATGSVELDELAKRFDVSKMTVHRDLDELESSGLLRKVRGGATIEPGTQFESNFHFREKQGVAAKFAIAQAALKHVEPGMTVIINDGSTAAVLGKCLIDLAPLTVISNNAAVLHALSGINGISLMSLGGTFSKKYNGFFGKLTEDALHGLRVDIAFISSPAVSGTEVFHMDEAVTRTKRAMMAVAARSVLLINHARMEAQALHRFADLKEFAAVITDGEPPVGVAEGLRAAGISLTIGEIQEH